jgi:2,3-bisphosphoglycerate-independent phosphoglycerate mutase
LDGWGIGRNDESNPIHVVRPETFARLEREYPATSLQASGISVGLPWGETGSSEVGHLTLGAGKVIYQHYPKITMAIQDGSFFENPVLKGAFDHARAAGSRVHFVGLLSDGNTHAAMNHLDALLQMAEREGIKETALHLFADGVDSSPKSLAELLLRIPPEKLATIAGRYYAMDRDKNWLLTRKTFDCITGGQAPEVKNLEESLTEFFSRNASEEYLPPLRLQPDRVIRANDAVVFFNFREDGMLQLAQAFLQPDFTAFPRPQLENLYVCTFTGYDLRLKNPVAFPADTVHDPLGKVLSDSGKTQLRLAEAHKYTHVTYFFNGYREEPFKNEYRAMIPSISSPRIEEHPELSASAITDRIIEAVRGQGFDFVLANYANADAMAHTGNYESCLSAVRILDGEIGKILKAVEETSSILLITSDHGNIEEALNPQTGEPQPQHGSNFVPLYIAAPEFKGRKFPNADRWASETMGILSDVAPTVLGLLGVEKPAEMTGRNLVSDLLQ